MDKPYHTQKEGNHLRKKRGITYGKRGESLTEKEGNHLRKKRGITYGKRSYDLSQIHPDDLFKIEKGKLYQNGTVIDKFDLNNQFFH